MKFTITMKDPDGVYESMRDAAEAQMVADGIPEKRRDALREAVSDELDELVRDWFEYGEYVNVEIDTEAKTATVLRVRGGE